MEHQKRLELFTRWLPLVRAKVSQLPTYNGVTTEDLQQEAAIYLWKCTSRFDEGRGVQFNTYLTKYLLREVLKVYRTADARAWQSVHTMQDESYLECAAGATKPKAETVIELKEVFQGLPVNKVNLVYKRALGYSFQEIANQAGKSLQAASAEHKRALQCLN